MSPSLVDRHFRTSYFSYYFMLASLPSIYKDGTICAANALKKSNKLWT